MSSYSFNPSKFKEENTFKPIPVGDYSLKCIEAEETMSKKNIEMFKFKFEIIGGKYAKRTLFYYVVINQYTNRTIGNMLASCGFDPNNISNVTPKMFLGKIGLAHIKHDTFDGKPTNKISYFKVLKAEKSSEPELPPEENTTDNALEGENFGDVDPIDVETIEEDPTDFNVDTF